LRTDPDRRAWHRAQAAASRKHADLLRAQALSSCEVVSAHLFAEVQGGVGAGQPFSQAAAALGAAIFFVWRLRRAVRLRAA
ncbi:MAG: hypothetical protein ACXVW7_08295, partial [Trebonia sp.]